MPEIRARLRGHRQFTDAVLLDFAIRRGGRLATLDETVLDLLAEDSEYRNAVTVIPHQEIKT